MAALNPSFFLRTTTELGTVRYEFSQVVLNNIYTEEEEEDSYIYNKQKAESKSQCDNIFCDEIRVNVVK